MRWLQSTPYSFVFVMDLIPRLEKGLQWWTWRVTKWPTNRWHCLWSGQEVFSKVPKGSLLARVVSLMFSKGVNQHLCGWRSPGLRAIHLTETRRISRVKLCTFQQSRVWTHRADLEEQRLGLGEWALRAHLAGCHPLRHWPREGCVWKRLPGQENLAKSWRLLK